jgi:uncharacterized protein YegP (UPF0339 family)
MKIHKKKFPQTETKDEGGVKLAGERFEIFKDAAGKFRFRLRAQNGEIIAENQGCESKEGAQKGIASIKENASKAETKDCTTLKPTTFSFFRTSVST